MTSYSYSTKQAAATAGKTEFHIRGLTEGPEDIRFMIEAFDAALPELAAVGSGEQWGTVTFAQRPDKNEKLKVLEQARGYQTTGEGDPIQIFIAEVEIPSPATDELPASMRIRTDDDGKKFLAVGSVMLSEDIFPEYMKMQFDQPTVKQALDGTSDYVYLEALITDFRTGSWRKGAGAALIERCRQYCKEKGIKTIYLDGYAGNNRILPRRVISISDHGAMAQWCDMISNSSICRYYESQGFSLVQDCIFHLPDKIRTMAFFRMDVMK